MVSSIETAIMGDLSKLQSVITPKELIFKSNPGIFAKLREAPNAHKSYAFLSKRHLQEDRNDDLRKKSFKVGSETKLPRIFRASSMKNINLPNNMHKRHYHSSHDLSRSEKKDPSIVALHMNQPRVHDNDVQHNFEQEEKENMKGYGFPQIQMTSFSKRTSTQDQSNTEETFMLPQVRPEISGSLQNGTQSENIVNHLKESTRYGHKLPSSKLEKWFLEMPATEFEKADNIWKENNDAKDIGARRQRNSNQTTIKVPNLKPLQNIPTKYLELRTERSIQNKDVSINRGQYKLKQKSLLHLKMLEVGEKDRSYKTTTDLDFDSYPYALSMDRMLTHESKPNSEDFVTAGRQNGDGMKTINIGDFAIDAFNSKPNAKFTFAHLQRGMTHPLNGLSFVDVKPSEEICRYRYSKLDGKTAVVNLEMQKHHSTTSSNELRTAPETMNLETHGSNDEYFYERKEDEYSMESTISDKGFSLSKSPLKKFKQLEVFSNGKKPKHMPVVLPDNPLYKLDLTSIPTKTSFDRTDSDAERYVHSVPRLSFHFQKDEVVLERTKSSVVALSEVPKTKHTRIVLPSNPTFLTTKVKLHTRKSNVPEPLGLTQNTNEETLILSNRTNQFSDNTYTMTPDFPNTPIQMKQETDVTMQPLDALNEAEDAPAPPPSRQVTGVIKEFSGEETKPYPIQRENTKDVATSISSVGGTESTLVKNDNNQKQENEPLDFESTINPLDVKPITEENEDVNDKMSDKTENVSDEMESFSKVQLSNFVDQIDETVTEK